MDTFARLKQFLKALLPIDVTAEGMEIALSEPQFSKAEFPILVIEDGTEMLVSFSKLSNALSDIEVTLLSMTIFVTSLLYFDQGNSSGAS